MGYYRRRSDTCITAKNNSTGSDWGYYFGKNLRWEGSELKGDISGRVEAYIHISYNTPIGAMIHFRGEMVLVRSTAKYSVTTTQHERSLFDIFGYGPRVIYCNAEELRDLERRIMDRYHGRPRRQLPGWVKRRVDNRIKLNRLTCFQIDEWTFTIFSSQEGKIKGLCAYGKGDHKDGRTLYWRMKKGEVIPQEWGEGFAIPADVRAKMVSFVRTYHESKLSRKAA